MNQSLAWNTTAPVKERPILLYLFDSSKPKGKNFDIAKTYEVKIYPDNTVVKVAEGFICEKACLKNELTKSYKGREMLNAYKRQLGKVPYSKRKAHVVFLNSKGEVLYVVKNAKSAGKFAQYMKLALKKNAKSQAEAKKVVAKS